MMRMIHKKNLWTYKSPITSWMEQTIWMNNVIRNKDASSNNVKNHFEIEIQLITDYDKHLISARYWSMDGREPSIALTMVRYSNLNI